MRRLASVIRSPGFWDLCPLAALGMLSACSERGSMLGSIQSFRLQLDIREMRDHVKRLTEEWAEQNPQDTETHRDKAKQFR